MKERYTAFAFYVCFTRHSDGKLDKIGPFDWNTAVAFAERWLSTTFYQDAHIRWRE